MHYGEQIRRRHHHRSKSQVHARLTERNAHLVDHAVERMADAHVQRARYGVHVPKLRTNLLCHTNAVASQIRATEEVDRASSQKLFTHGIVGLEATAGDYVIEHGHREAIRAAWRAFFHDWDVLLSPIVIVPAPPHTTDRMDQRVVTIDGKPGTLDKIPKEAGVSLRLCADQKTVARIEAKSP